MCIGSSLIIVQRDGYGLNYAMEWSIDTILFFFWSSIIPTFDQNGGWFDISFDGWYRIFRRKKICPRHLCPRVDFTHAHTHFGEVSL